MHKDHWPPFRPPTKLPPVLTDLPMSGSDGTTPVYGSHVEDVFQMSLSCFIGGCRGHVWWPYSKLFFNLCVDFLSSFRCQFSDFGAMVKVPIPAVLVSWVLKYFLSPLIDHRFFVVIFGSIYNQVHDLEFYHWFLFQILIILVKFIILCLSDIMHLSIFISVCI